MASFLPPLLRNLRIQRAGWRNFPCLPNDRVNSHSCSSPALVGSFSSGKKNLDPRCLARRYQHRLFLFSKKLYKFLVLLEVIMSTWTKLQHLFARLRDWHTPQEFRQEVRNKNYSTLYQYIWDTWWIGFGVSLFPLLATTCHVNILRNDCKNILILKILVNWSVKFSVWTL